METVMNSVNAVTNHDNTLIAGVNIVTKDDSTVKARVKSVTKDDNTVTIGVNTHKRRYSVITGVSTVTTAVNTIRKWCKNCNISSQHCHKTQHCQARCQQRHTRCQYCQRLSTIQGVNYVIKIVSLLT